MIISIPEGVYTMKDKRSIVKLNAKLYKKATRKEKTVILDELVRTTHLHRKYIITLLNKAGKVYYTPQGVKLIGDLTVTYLHRRGRKKKYSEQLLPWLKAIWVLSGYRSSIHLRKFIENHQSWLLAGIAKSEIDAFPKELRSTLRPLQHIPPTFQNLLQTISSATIERLLKSVKKRYRLQHRYKPHPYASVLKRKILVEAHFNKPRGKIGYTELDTVHHCGAMVRGNYCLTLSEVEVNSHWSELRALRNKAHHWVYQALQDIDQTVPFRIHSRHVDNGSEFINRPISAYTERHGMRYTRSRAYHKNDNPVVESRHWILVRSYVGYRRYDTELEYRVLAKLMRLISLLHNYFIPTMRLVKRVRIGGKVRKRYDIDIPVNRVLKANEIAQNKKRAVLEKKKELSYFKILNQILRLQQKLDQSYRKKYNHSIKDDEKDER